MQSLFYNQDEYTIIPLDVKTPDDKPIFRKTTRYQIEIDIVKILKANPHPNIVIIYDINHKYIDLELVDTKYIKNKSEISSKEIDVIREQMKSAKDHMQSLGISYVDWKLDNIGYSHQTNQYKLFDFDGSGLFDKENNNRWIICPEPFNIYRYSILRNIIDPIGMDNKGFNNYSGFGIMDS